MKISVPCPESVRIHLSTEDANNSPAEGITIAVEGALLSFDLAGASLDERLESLRDFDAWIGLAIADDDRPEVIRALSDLKATALGVEQIVVRESSYTNAQSESATDDSAEATTTDAESHLQGEQHTSSEGSSERHGVEPNNQNEEIVHEQAQQEADRSPRRRRAAGR